MRQSPLGRGDVLLAQDKTVMQQLINGNKVTLEDAFS